MRMVYIVDVGRAMAGRKPVAPTSGEACQGTTTKDEGTTMAEKDPDPLGASASRYPGADRRWDWLMRQFVEDIVGRKTPEPERRRRALLERGVPYHVADRVLPPGSSA